MEISDLYLSHATPLILYLYLHLHSNTLAVLLLLVFLLNERQSLIKTKSKQLSIL